MNGNKNGKVSVPVGDEAKALKAVQNETGRALASFNNINTTINKAGPTLNNTLKMVQNNVKNTSVMLNKFNSTNIDASTKISFNYSLQGDSGAEEKTQGAFSKIWESVKSIGGAAVKTGVQGLGKLISSTTESAGKLDQMKSSTGLDYEELQRLQYISSKLSVDFDKAGGAVGAMSQNMSAGGKTGAETANAFKTLGVQVDASKPKGQIFNETITALSQMQDQSKRNELAFKIFGSGAEDLFPILNAGSGEIQRLGSEADKLGLVMGNDQVAAANQLGNTIGTLKSSFVGIGNSIAAGVMPQIQAFVGGIMTNMPQIQVIAQGVLGTLANCAVSILPLILNFVNQLIPIIMQNMPVITSIISGIFNFIQLLLPPVAQLVLGILPVLIQIISVIFAVFQPLFNVLIILIQSLLPPVMQILQALMPLLQAMTPIISFIANLIGVVLVGAIKFLMPLVQGVLDTLTAIIDGAGKAISWIGGLFGLSNKSINVKANVPKFANGGFANSPSIFGEAGPEVAIPIKYKNPRSLTLLNQTAKAIGAEPDGGMPGVALSFNFYGPVNNKNDVCEGIRLSKDYIVQGIEDMINEKERVAFG